MNAPPATNHVEHAQELHKAILKEIPNPLVGLPPELASFFRKEARKHEADPVALFAGTMNSVASIAYGYQTFSHPNKPTTTSMATILVGEVDAGKTSTTTWSTSQLEACDEAKLAEYGYDESEPTSYLSPTCSLAALGDQWTENAGHANMICDEGAKTLKDYSKDDAAKAFNSGIDGTPYHIRKRTGLHFVIPRPHLYFLITVHPSGLYEFANFQKKQNGQPDRFLVIPIRKYVPENQPAVPGQTESTPELRAGFDRTELMVSLERKLSEDRNDPILNRFDYENDALIYIQQVASNRPKNPPHKWTGAKFMEKINAFITVLHMYWCAFTCYNKSQPIVIPRKFPKTTCVHAVQIFDLYDPIMAR